MPTLPPLPTACPTLEAADRALEAANPAYETRILPQDKVRVQGRLVGLIRSY